MSNIRNSRSNGPEWKGGATRESNHPDSAGVLEQGRSAYRNILMGNVTSKPVLPSLDEIRKSLIDELQPRTQSEYDLIDDMAFADWRLKRLWQSELNTSSYIASDYELDREIKIYFAVELPLCRMFDRAYKTLLRLQKHRRATAALPNEPEKNV